MVRYWYSLAALVIVVAAARADNKAGTVELDGLKSKVPATWKEKTPESRMQAFHYVIPKAEGDKHDGAMIIFFFGPGGGGGVKANVERWKGMIKPPEGKSIDDVCKVDELKVGEVKVTMIDATGTYTHKMRPFDPNEEGEKRPDYRLIGIVFESPNGPYFFRVIGPAKTIGANKKALDEFIKGFK